MGRRRVVTKRATYQAGVCWIAINDNAGDDYVPSGCRDGALQREVINRIKGYISTLLLADLFGADPEQVASDIFRERQISRIQPWPICAHGLACGACPYCDAEHRADGGQNDERNG